MATKQNAPVNGRFRLDMAKHVISGARGDVALTPREFDLLACLISHAGTPMSRSELLRDAWEWENADDLKTKTVDMHVRRLRLKLERAGLDPRIVSTIRGRGYVFIAPIR